MEGCGFRDRSPDFQASNAQILGVSFDTPAENAAFVAKHHFPYPILCDTDRSVGVAYGAATDGKAGHAKRITVLVRPDGIVERIWDKVDVRSHPGDVLDAIKAAPASK